MKGGPGIPECMCEGDEGVIFGGRGVGRGEGQKEGEGVAY